MQGRLLRDARRREINRDCITPKYSMGEDQRMDWIPVQSTTGEVGPPGPHGAILNPSLNSSLSPIHYPSLNPSFNPSLNPSPNLSNPSFIPGLSPGLNPRFNPGLILGFNPGLNPALNPSFSSSFNCNNTGPPAFEVNYQNEPLGLLATSDNRPRGIRGMLEDFSSVLPDQDTGSETSGISVFTSSGSEVFRGRFSSGPSSVTSDLEDDLTSWVRSQAEVKLEDINLRDLSQKIGDENETLATYLGFKKADIDRFRDAYPRQMADRTFLMLVTWRMGAVRPKVDDLAKALAKSGRNDLAAELRGPEEEEEEECWGAQAHHTPNAAFKRLLVEFQDQVKTEDERAKVTYLIQQDQITGAGVPLPSTDKPMTTFQIIQCLQKYNYLGPNNVWYLQYILHVLGKKDLYRRVWDYGSRRLKTHGTLYLHEPRFVKVSNHTLVKFKLVGDAKNFGGIRLAEFEQMLADNFAEEVRYINCVGVQEGCIEFFFQVRIHCAEKACAAAKEKHQWLLQAGVLEVRIFGEEEEEVIPIQELDSGQEAQLTKVSQLLMALLEDNKQQAKLLLAQGANPNGKLCGKPMIHWAIYLDKEYFVQMLLNHNANRDQKDENGHTPEKLAKFLGQCRNTLTWDIDLEGIINKHFPRVRKKSGDSGTVARLTTKNLQKAYGQERRQFVCDPCNNVWSTYASAEKPVSRCSRCHHLQKAIPIKNKLKRSKYVCPKCKRIFTGWEYEGIRMRCYTCQTLVVPSDVRNGGSARQQDPRGNDECWSRLPRRKSSTSSLQRYAVSNSHYLKNQQRPNVSP